MASTLNIPLFLILISVTLQSVTAFDKIRCIERSNFTVCTTKYALISVRQTQDTDVFRHVFFDQVSKIVPYAFKDLSITKLDLHFTGDRNASFIPESFLGLPSVRTLTIRWASFDFSVNPFHYLGLLTDLNVEASYTHELPPKFLSDFPNLKNFTLTGHNLISITEQTFSMANENLERLNLNEGWIQSVEHGSFRKLEHLKYLTLSRNNLTDLRTGVFDGLHELEELNLQYSRIETVSGNLFWGLTHLKKLDMSLNEIKSIPITCFRGLKNVTELDLSDNKLTSLEPGVFSDLKRLQYLSLSDNEIEVIHYSVFNSLANLRVLNLGRNHITTIAAYAFSGLKLDVLSLTRNYNAFSIKSDTFNGLDVNEIDLYQFLYDVEIELMAFRGAQIRKLHVNSRTSRRVDRFDWWLDDSVQISVSS